MNEEIGNLSFILQVKALRDGYLLPATWEYNFEEDVLYIYNVAIIEDEIRWVWADDDYTEFVSYTSPLPSRPIAND